MPIWLDPNDLNIDPVAETERICSRLRTQLTRLRRRGVVVGLSGGVDSSVTAALAVRALGPQRVLGLEMPERHSAEETLRLSGLVAASLGLGTQRLEVTAILESLGCYERYEEAVRRIIPGFGPGWKSKLVSPSILENDRLQFFYLVAQSPEGRQQRQRLPLHSYLEILAATNFKQRVRKMLEYYHADRMNYAVAGTPNRLEYDQGFFVKLGDGAADLKPIAHLYKSQVYQLAEHLGVPEEIRRRPPTTDTYSLAQGQDEFFFSLPYRQLDLCMFGKNRGLPPEAVAPAADLSAEQVRRVYQDIDRKRAATRYQHLPPLLIEEVPEIRGGIAREFAGLMPGDGQGGSTGNEHSGTPGPNTAPVVCLGGQRPGKDLS